MEHSVGNRLEETAQSRVLILFFFFSKSELAFVKPAIAKYKNNDCSDS